MGREIRMVPAGWEHPRNEQGRFKPLYNKTLEEAATEWADGFLKWERGEEYYRPAFTSEATHFQIYETVSEGTPVSPVFASRAELADWLVSEGTSRSAADKFAEGGWAPSGMYSPSTGFVAGIESLNVT